MRDCGLSVVGLPYRIVRVILVLLVGEDGGRTEDDMHALYRLVIGERRELRKR